MCPGVCWSQQYWTGREVLRSGFCCGVRHWRAHTREPCGNPMCVEYVIIWFKWLGKTFLMVVRLMECHCGRSIAFAFAWCPYTHTLSHPSLKDHLLGLVYAQPGIFEKHHIKPPACVSGVGCSSGAQLFQMRTIEGGWLEWSPGFMCAAVLNPNRSLGAGNTSLVQLRSCFSIQNEVLEGKTLPPFVLFS